jgi:hypothetical protein
LEEWNDGMMEKSMMPCWRSGTLQKETIWNIDGNHEEDVAWMG